MLQKNKYPEEKRRKDGMGREEGETDRHAGRGIKGQRGRKGGETKVRKEKRSKGEGRAKKGGRMNGSSINAIQKQLTVQAIQM